MKNSKSVSPATSPIQPGRMVTRSVTNTPKSSHTADERPTPPRVTRGRACARRALFVGNEDEDYESPVPQPKRRRTTPRESRRGGSVSYDDEVTTTPQRTPNRTPGSHRPGRPASSSTPSRPTSNQKPIPILNSRTSRRKQKVTPDLFPGCLSGESRRNIRESSTSTTEKSDEGTTKGDRQNSPREEPTSCPPSPVTGPTVPIPPPAPTLSSSIVSSSGSSSSLAGTRSGSTTPPEGGGKTPPRGSPKQIAGLPLPCAYPPSLSLALIPGTSSLRGKKYDTENTAPTHAVPKVPSLITFQDGSQPPTGSNRTPVLHEDRRKAKQVNHFLSTHARKFATFEWFYPSIDYYYFANSDFTKMMAEYQADKLVAKLNRDELNVLRIRMEKPLRMSKRYFAEERLQLQRYRDAVRHCHTRAPIACDKFSHLQGCDIPAPLRKGARVQVLCPISFQVRQGTVLKAKDTGYRIRYDEVYGMADELVSDLHVMCIGEVERQRPPSPMRSRRRAAQASPYSQSNANNYGVPHSVTSTPPRGSLQPSQPQLPSHLKVAHQQLGLLGKQEHPQAQHAALSQSLIPGASSLLSSSQSGSSSGLYNAQDSWRIKAEEGAKTAKQMMENEGSAMAESQDMDRHQRQQVGGLASIDRVQLAKLFCTVHKKSALINQLRTLNTEGELMKKNAANGASGSGNNNGGDALTPEFLRAIEHTTNDIRSLNVAICHLMENLATNPQDSQVNLQHAQSLLHHQILQQHSTSPTPAMNSLSSSIANSLNSPTIATATPPAHSINRKHVPSHPNSMCGELFERTRQQAKLLVASALVPFPQPRPLDGKKDEKGRKEDVKDASITIPSSPATSNRNNRPEKYELTKTVSNLVTQTVAFLMHLKNCLDPNGQLQQVPSSLAVTLDSALLAMRPEMPANYKAHDDLGRLVRLIKEQIIGESGSDYY